MHSSRMRTGRSLTVCWRLLPGGVSAPGGCLARGVSGLGGWGVWSGGWGVWSGGWGVWSGGWGVWSGDGVSGPGGSGLGGLLPGGSGPGGASGPGGLVWGGVCSWGDGGIPAFTEADPPLWTDRCL